MASVEMHTRRVLVLCQRKHSYIDSYVQDKIVPQIEAYVRSSLGDSVSIEYLTDGTINNRNTFDAKTLGENINYLNEGINKNKNNNHELSLQFKTKLDTLGTTFDVVAYSNLFDRKPITDSNAKDFVSNTTFYNYGNNDFIVQNH